MFDEKTDRGFCVDFIKIRWILENHGENENLENENFDFEQPAHHMHHNIKKKILKTVKKVFQIFSMG